MAFIGKEPSFGSYSMLDSLTASATANYNLTLDSVAFVPESANHLLVSLNGVIQKAGSSFTVSGSTLTFASTLASSDSIDFILALGSVLDIGTPSDATVTNAKTNFVSTSSSAGLQIKGDNTTAGTLQLNCEQNSHGIKLRSPSHSSGQSYTLTFPTSAPQADKALITDGSGNLSFGDAGGGKVLQVVSSGNVTTTFSTSSETYQAMNVSVNITPSATTSKVLVFANVSGYYIYGGSGSSGDDGASGAIYRDSTEIYGSNERFGYNRDASSSSQELGIPLTLQVLDSPSTTSQITYGIYMRAFSGATVNAYSYDKSIIAMEIGV